MATPDRTYADYPHKPATMTADHTGLRLTEMLSLEWANVDLERTIFTVTDETTKSSKQRHIPINCDLLAVLIAWKAQAHKRYVFADIHGKPLKRIQAWNGLRAAPELADFRWHDFRHDFASRLVMAGVALNTVRDLLGHADLKMTLRYAHLSPDCRAAAVEMLCSTPTQPVPLTQPVQRSASAQEDHYSMAA
jgi:integrase